MKANYHTHSKYCGHASGEVEEYVKVAIERGIETLGFSCHVPYPFNNGYVSGYRIQLSDHEKYVNDVASRLGGVSARFEKIVEGKMGSSLEIPNVRSTSVSFKESFLALPPRAKGGNFIVPFGKAIDGTNINANFIKFPHLLVSGTTGSGKSVYLNSLLTTLII